MSDYLDTPTILDDDDANYRLGWLRVSVRLYLDALDQPDPLLRAAATESHLARLRRDIDQLDAAFAARARRMTPPSAEEEYDLEADDAFVAECSRCHTTRPVRLSKDPFIEEVYAGEPEAEELEVEPLCNPCYTARREDV